MRKALRKAERGLAAFATIVGCLVTLPGSAESGDSVWGRDKALHFSASGLIAGDGYAGASLGSRREGTRAAVGAGVAVAAGIAKEVYDRCSGGDVSGRDLAWDVLGATTGVTVAWLIDRFFF